jgi:hypothetical protein
MFSERFGVTGSDSSVEEMLPLEEGSEGSDSSVGIMFPLVCDDCG